MTRRWTAPRTGPGTLPNFPSQLLQELDAGVQFPGQFPGEKIPTLDEVFETVGKRVYMNVELTNYSTPNDALVPKVVELVKKHRYGRTGALLVFLSPATCRRHACYLPEVPRGLLTLPGLMGFWGRTFGWRGDYAALNPHLTDVNARVGRLCPRGWETSQCLDGYY